MRRRLLHALRAPARLCRAVRLYAGSRLTWRTCRRVAADSPRTRIVKRADGFLYIEPRA